MDGIRIHVSNSVIDLTEHSILLISCSYMLHP
jgi:hypothetical protein